MALSGDLLLTSIVCFLLLRGLFNLLCRLFRVRSSDPPPLPSENRADENHSSDPPAFPCGVHDGTATGSCTCGLDTLGDGSVDFYKFEERLRDLLEIPDTILKFQESLKKNEKKRRRKKKFQEQFYVGAARIFPSGELREAVQFFDPVRKLGDGGYGSVYLGKLKDGLLVAVKELHDKDEMYVKEIINFCNLRHQNLVTLYGCTSGSEDPLLAYEYVTNGNVAEHLHEHGEAGSKVLTWDLRIQIAIETAEALSFLHFYPGCPPIIHCDIKTDNILLDDNFHVKVCDFGLSSQFSSLYRGTLGYLDPEFDKVGRLTAKSDVYSFGVVLLELISGQRAVDVLRGEIYLVDMITKEPLEQLVDRNIGYQSDPETRRMINLVADLACSCLRSEGNKRPFMQEVAWKLKRIRDNKDHRIEHIDYTSPDQASIHVTFDISNIVQLVSHEYSGWVSNSCGRKPCTQLLTSLFANPAYHPPSCSCRHGLASSACFFGVACCYVVSLAALNQIPLQAAQKIVNCLRKNSELPSALNAGLVQAMTTNPNWLVVGLLEELIRETIR